MKQWRWQIALITLLGISLFSGCMPFNLILPMTNDNAVKTAKETLFQVEDGLNYISDNQVSDFDDAHRTDKNQKTLLPPRRDSTPKQDELRKCKCRKGKWRKGPLHEGGIFKKGEMSVLSKTKGQSNKETGDQVFRATFSQFCSGANSPTLWKEKEVVVIGDEMVDFLRGVERHRDCRIYTESYNGLILSDAKNRLHEIICGGLPPDKIIFHVGSHDVVTDLPAVVSTVTNRFDDLVDEIKTLKESVSTTLAISGILPRNDPVTSFNNVINMINSNVGWYARKQGVEFIDFTHIFWEKGELKEDLYQSDGSLTQDGLQQVEDLLFEGEICRRKEKDKSRDWGYNNNMRYRKKEHLDLKDILPIERKTYDKHLPPKKDGQPTTVYFHVTVLSVDSIDEESMTYVADIFLAQSWQDYRLRLPENMTEGYRILDVGWLKYIWRPDSFFKNAKKVTFHDMSVPNHYLWLYYDKTLLYMAKLTLELSCAMKFEAYPHDTQNCSMMIESLSHTADDLVFLWNITSPLVVSEDVELPQLDIVESSTEDCTLEYSTGNFTCLAVVFHLKRRLGYHLFHTYVPTTLIVVMSWISFWIRPEAIPARVTLGVTSLLTLATQNTQSQSSLPPVSYVKAIDVWMSSCTVFVFMSLMEFAVVNHYMGYTGSNKLMRGYSVDELDKLLRRPNGFKPRSNSFGSPPRNPNTCWEMDVALAIDRFSRFFFPLSFLVLNLVYWFTYYY